ncbi:apolipoprotein N-acyltransferase [Salipiger sp. P9]|uniref:apolipoprotein N-acyltransferase n=1 Tax=Salipiger pentaromativorans TaxID=2943193 RepID=UPI0021582BAD|nr:apolipoprotein N-acyltransferase [Salipiger pentaromativorans]MCR8546643.1 apolipoprotein N-acyltransferase [Salipiger pentaromativorans]
MVPDSAGAGPDRLPRWARLPLAILAGALMGLGQAPYDLPWLAFPGLVGAFLLFSTARSPLYAVGAGWGVGLGYFGLVLGWVIEPFQVDAATTGWMAPFALFGLAGGLALFWALAFWGAVHAPGRRRLFALAVCWAAAELARAYVFTGFAWAMLGYLWAPVAAIQWVSVIGPHGLTFVTLATAALVAAALRRGRRGLWPGLAGGGLLAALLAGGAALVPPLQDLGGRPVVRLIQPNAPQHQKWDRAFVPIFFERQVDFTAAPSQDGLPRPVLTVWPETALPMLLNHADEALGIVTDAGFPGKVVVGIQREEDGGYFNSLVLAEQGPRVLQVYDKHHLVPFGEYMPAAELFERWNIIGLAQRAAGGYTPGPGPQLLDLGPELGQALPLICYEAVFPQDLRGPGRPALLLQITNDAWFGTFSGPYQHLAQARIRAIEQGLPLLRAANTGVSAVIDGAGRVLDELPLGEAGYLDTRLPPPLPPTPYSRMGDLPAWGLFLLLGLAAFWRRRRVSH